MSKSGRSTDHPLSDVPLARAILDGLALAAERSDGQPLGTLPILASLSVVDPHAGWEALQLRSTYLAPQDISRLADPDLTPTALWEDSTLTASAAAALRTAATIAQRHGLLPMPVGVLVLGLLWDPRSAASRALLEESTIGHRELLDCVQDELLGVNLDLTADDGDAAPATGPARLGTWGRGDPAGGRESKQAEAIASAAFARAKAIERSDDPGSLALLIASLELCNEEKLTELLGSMLLDEEELTALLNELEGLQDSPAVDVLVRAQKRTEGELEAAALIAAVALTGSPRITEALRRCGLSCRELGAQMTEWLVTRMSPPETTVRVLATSLLTLASSIATSVLLVVNAAGSGEWVKVLLLIPVWAGYPQEGPLFGSLLAVVLGLLVSPLVALAQAVSVLCEIAQADAERFVRWTRTGVRLSLREQRYVTMRLISKRGRLMRMLRQNVLVQVRSRKSTGAA
jgi:hypothetical protein